MTDLTLVPPLYKIIGLTVFKNFEFTALNEREEKFLKQYFKAISSWSEQEMRDLVSRSNIKKDDMLGRSLVVFINHFLPNPESVAPLKQALSGVST